MIIILHRERSEKLAGRFYEVMTEDASWAGAWPDLPEVLRARMVAAFDSLIQDGLISEHQHRPEGRE
jgi:hypothetical protein